MLRPPVLELMPGKLMREALIRDEAQSFTSAPHVKQGRHA
jgi:hypothetical protein